MNEIKQGILFYLYLFLYAITFYVRENPLVLYSLLFLVLLMAYYEYKITFSFISPMMFWILFWLAIIAIGRIDLHYYDFKTEWTIKLHVIIVLNTWVFYFTYSFFRHFCFSFRVGRRKRPEILCSNYKLYNYTLLLLLFIIALYIANIVYKRNIPQFSGDVDYYRRDFVETPFFSLINCSRVVFAFVPLAYKSLHSVKKKRNLILFSVVVSFLELLTGWRTYVFQEVILLSTTGFMISSMRTAKERSKNFKKVIWLGIVALFVIGYIFVTRGGVHGSIPEILSFVFQMIYLYFAPSLLNFQSGAFSLIPKGYPLYTTEAIWSIFIPTSRMVGFEDINQNIGAFNVSTYLLQPFADGGVLGTLIWTSLIAWISTKAFSRASYSKNPFWLTTLGVMNIVVFNFHNGFFLRSSSVLVWLVIAAYFSHACYQKEVTIDG